MWTKTLVLSMVTLLATSLTAENSPQNEIWFKGRPTANADKSQNARGIEQEPSKVSSTSQYRNTKANKQEPGKVSSANQNSNMKRFKREPGKTFTTDGTYRYIKSGEVADLGQGPGYSMTPVSQETAVPEAVSSFMDSFSQAWNAHDPDKMAAMWAAEGDLIDPWGTRAADRNAIRNLFKSDQTGRFKDTTFESTVETVKSITPDLYLVDMTAKVVGAKNSKGEKEDISHHVVWLLRKQGDKLEAVAVRPYQFVAQTQQ